MKSSNIVTIAKEAGVSTATVSRVLNNHPSVSKETRQKVIAVINKTDYIPNPLAKGLASNSTSTVGILTANVTTPHYSKVVDELCKKLFSLNYTPILCNGSDDKEVKIRQIKSLINMGCRYILCIGSVFKDSFADTSLASDNPNVKYIMNNCIISSNSSYSVLIDEEYALKLCVEHLIKKGHTQIAYVKDASSYSGQHKKEAFCNQMRAFGLVCNNKLIIDTNRGLKYGKEAARELIDSGEKFTAVIFGDDITAVGGMQFFQSIGKKIPEDIAIIGFNNSIVSECTTPLLTTIDPKSKATATFMISIMTQLENDSAPPRIIKVSPELIVRQST